MPLDPNFLVNKPRPRGRPRGTTKRVMKERHRHQHAQNDTSYIDETDDWANNAAEVLTKRDKVINTALRDGVGSTQKYKNLLSLKFQLPRPKTSGLTKSKRNKDETVVLEPRFMDPFSESMQGTSRTNLKQYHSRTVRSKSESRATNVKYQRRKTQSEPGIPKSESSHAEKTTFKDAYSPTNSLKSIASSQRSIVSWLDKTPPPPKRPPLHDYGKKKRPSSTRRYFGSVTKWQKSKDAHRRQLTSRRDTPTEKHTTTSEETGLWRRKLDLEPSRYIKQANIPTSPALSSLSPSPPFDSTVFYSAGRRNLPSKCQEQPLSSTPIPFPALNISPVAQADTAPNKGIEQHIGESAVQECDENVPSPTVEPFDKADTTNLISPVTCRQKMFSDSSVDERIVVQIPLLPVDSDEEPDSRKQSPEKHLPYAGTKEGFQNPSLSVPTNSSTSERHVEGNSKDEATEDEPFYEPMDTTESDVDSAVESGEEEEFYTEANNFNEHYCESQQIMTQAAHQFVMPFRQDIKTSDKNPSQPRPLTPPRAPTEQLHVSEDPSAILRTIISDLKCLTDKYSILLLHYKPISKTNLAENVDHCVQCSPLPSTTSRQKETTTHPPSAMVTASPDVVCLISPVMELGQNDSPTNHNENHFSRKCLLELDAAAKVCDEFSKLLRKAYNVVNSTNSYPSSQILPRLRPISKICKELELAINKLLSTFGK